MGGGIGRGGQNCAWVVGSDSAWTVGWRMVRGHGYQEEGQNGAEDQGTGDFLIVRLVFVSFTLL